MLNRGHCLACELRLAAIRDVRCEGALGRAEDDARRFVGTRFELVDLARELLSPGIVLG
ncbi:hypothetical protein BH20ACT13_BH20ACT13_10300 [soil metagenome]